MGDGVPVSVVVAGGCSLSGVKLEPLSMAARLSGPARGGGVDMISQKLQILSSQQFSMSLLTKKCFASFETSLH